MANAECMYCTCMKQEFNFSLLLSLSRSLDFRFLRLSLQHICLVSIFVFTSIDRWNVETTNTQRTVQHQHQQQPPFRVVHSVSHLREYIIWHTISVCICMYEWWVRTVRIYVYISVQIWCAFWGILYCFLFYFSLKLFKWMGENEAITTHYTLSIHNIWNIHT